MRDERDDHTLEEWVDEQPGQTVAVKLLHGVLDREEVQRFQAERPILAALAPRTSPASSTAEPPRRNGHTPSRRGNRRVRGLSLANHTF
ncbi:MAG: hypothetical protein ABEL04_04375 [Salinibacter sp.]|uniref:hypothetical protein n=1 Tax=Salinibacter sp. TaxID=2065818 RepID=UPI0035D4F7C8